MSSVVKLSNGVISDSRISLLGRLHGCGEDAALGKCVRLWAYCQSQDNWLLSEKITDGVTGSDGMTHDLVEAGLAVIEGDLVQIKSPSGKKSGGRSIQSEGGNDPFDFEAVYNVYPRKVGKTRGFRTMREQIKTQADYDALLRSVRTYAAHAANTETQYVKYFSTFMNTWRDWVSTPLDALNGEARRQAVQDRIEDEKRQLAVVNSTEEVDDVFA